MRCIISLVLHGRGAAFESCILESNSSLTLVKCSSCRWNRRASRNSTAQSFRREEVGREDAALSWVPMRDHACDRKEVPIRKEGGYSDLSTIIIVPITL